MSALHHFNSQQEFEEYVDYLMRTHKCTLEEAVEALMSPSVKTPREAETDLKIKKAAQAAKKYRITLPSFYDPQAVKDANATCWGCGQIIDGMCGNCQVPVSEEGMKALAREKALREKGPAPACTCNSKVLFDQGCQCAYSKWKRT